MKEQVDDSSGWDVVEDSQTQEDNINEVTNEVTNSPPKTPKKQTDLHSFFNKVPNAPKKRRRIVVDTESESDIEVTDLEEEYAQDPNDFSDTESYCS